jgi:hypothetical protein
MPQSSAQKEFARALLKDVAPEEEEFLDAYEAALSKTGSGRKIGTGMGLPPEIAGALGMIAVLVSRSVFDKLLEWGGQLAVQIAKKFVVDTSVDKLKQWLLAPGKSSLAGVLTAEGEIEILAIVQRDADAAGLSPDDTKKLKKAVISELGFPAAKRS